MIRNTILFYEGNMYGKQRVVLAALIVLLSGCSSKKDEQPARQNFSGAKEHIKYIIEDYSFGNGSGYIKNFVDNEYATNEFIIDSLADNFTKANSIEEISENVFRVETDRETLDITLVLENNKIKKIKAKAVGNDEEGI